MWNKIKSALKWIGATIISVFAIVLGKKLCDILKPKSIEVNGSIDNPNKKKDLKEADRIKADREELEKDI